MYTLEGGEWLTPSTYQITLKSASQGRNFDFLPGQYAAISFQKGWKLSPARCFSLVSSPDESGTLRFAMRVKGRYTRSITKLAPGTRVGVRGPFGGFVFDANYQSMVLLAGGIGVTPLMSMISYATRLSLSNNITLVYSCQSEQEASFRDQLVEMQKANPHFKVIYAISDGKVDKLVDQTWVKGQISPEVIAQVRQYSDSDTPYYVCGPPGFMKAMSRELIRQGVRPEKVLTEAFSQGSSRQTGRLRSWPYNVYALTSLGLVFGSLAVMGTDLINTLPKSSESEDENTSTIGTQELINNRQKSLDNVINSVPANISEPVTSQPNTTTPAPTPTYTAPATSAPAPRASVPTTTVQPRTQAS